MKRAGVCVSRILLVLFLMFFASASSWCEAMPFQVAIAIDADSLNAASYKTRGVFFVKTTIKNISSSDQTITVWTQHGWSWLSSSPDVSPGIDALQNISSRRTLHPGEAYESSVEMWIDPRGKRPVTFRMGFYADATRPVSGMTDEGISKTVSWSNEVTLDR
jgi:hypothetical protein